MKKKLESIKNAKFNESDAIKGGQSSYYRMETFSIELLCYSDFTIYVLWTNYPAPFNGVQCDNRY